MFEKIVPPKSHSAPDPPRTRAHAHTAHAQDHMHSDTQAHLQGKPCVSSIIHELYHLFINDLIVAVLENPLD